MDPFETLDNCRTSEGIIIANRTEKTVNLIKNFIISLLSVIFVQTPSTCYPLAFSANHALYQSLIIYLRIWSNLNLHDLVQFQIVDISFSRPSKSRQNLSCNSNWQNYLHFFRLECFTESWWDWLWWEWSLITHSSSLSLYLIFLNC